MLTRRHSLGRGLSFLSHSDYHNWLCSPCRHCILHNPVCSGRTSLHCNWLHCNPRCSPRCCRVLQRRTRVWGGCMIDLRHCGQCGGGGGQWCAGVVLRARRGLPPVASHQVSSQSLPPSRRRTPLPPLVATASAVATTRGTSRAPAARASRGTLKPLARESSTRWESESRACLDLQRPAQAGVWTRCPGRRGGAVRSQGTVVERAGVSIGDGPCGRRQFAVCQAACWATAVASTSAGVRVRVRVKG